MLKEYKTNERQIKSQQLQWKEKRKIGRPCKRCRFEVEKDLNVMGIRNKQVMVRDLRECRRISLEVDVRNGL
jgi:hypothetical protein